MKNVFRVLILLAVMAVGFLLGRVTLDSQSPDVPPFPPSLMIEGEVIASVRSMDLNECREASKSPGLSTTNTMYRTIRPTVFISKSRTDTNRMSYDLIDLDSLTIMAVSGCGPLDADGSTHFLYMDRWRS